MQDANRWRQQVSLGFVRLDEQRRRFVAGLLSKLVGAVTQSRLRDSKSLVYYSLISSRSTLRIAGSWQLR